jgi:hypothetical protein
MPARREEHDDQGKNRQPCDDGEVEESDHH